MLPLVTETVLLAVRVVVARFTSDPDVPTDVKSQMTVVPSDLINRAQPAVPLFDTVPVKPVLIVHTLPDADNAAPEYDRVTSKLPVAVVSALVGADPDRICIVQFEPAVEANDAAVAVAMASDVLVAISIPYFNINLFTVSSRGR